MTLFEERHSLQLQLFRYNYLLSKGGYIFGRVSWLVGLSVSVCEQHHSKSYEQIVMKFYGEVQGGTMKN